MDLRLISLESDAWIRSRDLMSNVGDTIDSGRQVDPVKVGISRARARAISLKIGRKRGFFVLKLQLSFKRTYVRTDPRTYEESKR